MRNFLFVIETYAAGLVLVAGLALTIYGTAKQCLIDPVTIAHVIQK